MIVGLRVIEPGLHTTIQDLGRMGHQAQGIPVSGAADQVALRAANTLVGNGPEAAALELALAGPLLEVRADSVRVALAGGTTGLDILSNDSGAARHARGLCSVRLIRGDRLRVAGLKGSAVAILAIEGGIPVPPFLGSRSTYVRGSFGGLHGRALAAGDLLPVASCTVDERPEVELLDLELLPPVEPIRVVLGPQDDFFTKKAMTAFLSESYAVTREADRMGLRLAGPKLDHAKDANIVSDGIAPGAIQVPGNGLPIILLADRQSAGGFPKIATVISADIPALGRVAPGAKLRFRSVTIEEAQVARRMMLAQTAALGARCTRVLRTAGAVQLAEVNLISGVADALEE